MKRRQGKVRTSDRVEIAYVDVGDGPALVCLHGCWMSGRFFADTQRRLGADRRVITIDFRGHGESEKSLHGHTIERYARDVEEVLAHLGVDAADLVGWSMGAFVMWEMLLSGAGPAVSSAIVVDQPATDLRTEDWPLGFADLPELFGLMRRVQSEWDEVVDSMLPSLTFDPPSAADLVWYGDEMRSVPPVIAASILFDQTVRDYRDRLGGIATPTLVCFGADEKIMPVALGRHLADALPGGRLAVFGRSGHMPFLEEPDHFDEQVVAFLEESRS